MGSQLTWKVCRWCCGECCRHSGLVLLGEPHQCCTGCLPSGRQQPQELALQTYEAAGVGSHHLTQGLRMGTDADCLGFQESAA